MSACKKAAVLVLCLVLICPALGARTYAEVKHAPLSLSAQSAVLIEAESGTVIYRKNADTPLPMASTTKIMTALVALSLAAPETVIYADAGAVGVEGSSIYLVEGEGLTLEQLLYALLLESANDAAAAIAIGLCGSIEAFAEEMNRTARTLGLRNTHFTNPHGLDDEAHYTTAQELALVARAALENELIRTIVSTYKYTIPHAALQTERLLVNHNKLLRTYDGCIGVKTGYTKRSGRSLVSAAERNGVRLIAVTINAPDDWQDHAKMLDLGFTLYKSVELCRADSMTHSLPIVGGTADSVRLQNANGARVTLPITAGEVRAVLECRRFAYAPISKGSVCGYIHYYCDTDGDGSEEKIASVPLRAEKSVKKAHAKRGFWERIKQFFLNLFS